MTGLTNGTLYRFRVRAVSSRAGLASAEASATPMAVPGAPTGFAATGGSNYVALAWTNPGDSSIEKYQFRLHFAGAWQGWQDIAGSGAGTVRHTVTPLPQPQSFRFQLRAVNAIGRGPSAEASASTTGAKPAKLTATLISGRKFLLIWDDPNDSSITRYEFQRKVQAQGATFAHPRRPDQPGHVGGRLAGDAQLGRPGRQHHHPVRGQVSEPSRSKCAAGESGGSGFGSRGRPQRAWRLLACL